MNTPAEDGSRAREVPSGTLGTVHNAVTLLRLLAEGPAYQPLTDLAARSGMAVPTVHRLLRSLVVAGLVQQDPTSSRYGLGPELARLAHAYLARLPVVKALSPYLVEVRNTTGATVMVSLLVRDSVVYVDRIDGTDPEGIYREAHAVHHALETAAGRVLAARADDTSWALVTASAPTQVADVTDGQRDAWRNARYVLLAPNELHDRGELAVPVLNGSGRVIAALSAALQRDDLEPELLAADLERAAKAASRTVGHG
jgi:IclR family transcriptional regulator, acetate operon repressor